MQFFWPLKEVTITQPFGRKNKAYAIGYHFGIDLRAKKGTTVFASQSGKVITAKNSPPYDGYGAHVVIEHEGGYYTVYAHLDDIIVKEGDTAVNGMPLGFTGGNPRDYGAPLWSNKIKGQWTKAGQSSGAHLHLELDKGQVGPKYGINPIPFLTHNKNLDMPAESNPDFIPEWAKPAIEKARRKGFKLPQPNLSVTGNQLAVILDKLGLLDKLPDNP